jgi:hypothetical protein
MSTNITEGNSPDACIKDVDGLCTDINGSKCKKLSSQGLCVSNDIDDSTSEVNKLNNSIMNFYDNTINKKNSNTIQSIQTNNFGDGNGADDGEDIYILKSQIIPPVCPICPRGPKCKNKIRKKCQPCPPCAKCPEPSFDCKKVPNYASERNAYLPRAILTDYSQYGM